MSTVFNITAPEFWYPSEDPYSLRYESGRWQASFYFFSYPGLVPLRTTQDSYTYEYIPGHTFWDTYSEASVLSLQVNGINQWTGHDDQLILFNDSFSTSTQPARTQISTTSYRKHTYNEMVLLKDLAALDFAGMYGTDLYYLGNGVYDILLELDVLPERMWRDYANVSEQIE